jgi:hypothetical protein
LIYLLARHRRALRPLRLLADRWVGLRVVGEVGGTLTFLIGLSHIPIANASAILQALPLAVTMGAALFLSEPVGWRRWGAILDRLCRGADHRPARSRRLLALCADDRRHSDLRGSTRYRNAQGRMRRSRRCSCQR